MSNRESTIDNRKDILLLLLFVQGASKKTGEPIVGRTRFMKLVYLFEKELMQKLGSFKGVKGKVHGFIPYYYGPFSKEVFEDIQFLENVSCINEESGEESSMAESSELNFFYDDLIIDRIEKEEAEEDYTEPIFSLSEKGTEFAREMYEGISPSERKSLQDFKAKFNSLSLSALLHYVYSAYPKLAAESRIKDSL